MLTFEVLDALAFTPEQLGNYYGPCIPHVEPDDFRREAFDVAPLAEVGILRDDHEVLRAGVIPDLPVLRAAQADVSDVGAVGKFAREDSHERRTQVLVMIATPVHSYTIEELLGKVNRVNMTLDVPPHVVRRRVVAPTNLAEAFAFYTAHQLPVTPVVLAAFCPGAL